MLRLALLLALVLTSVTAAGCARVPAPPVKAWQRGYLAKRAMQFDDGVATGFRQHLFSSREGAEGGFTRAAGGCGCN